MERVPHFVWGFLVLCQIWVVVARRYRPLTLRSLIALCSVKCRGRGPACARLPRRETADADVRRAAVCGAVVCRESGPRPRVGQTSIKLKRALNAGQPRDPPKQPHYAKGQKGMCLCAANGPAQGAHERGECAQDDLKPYLSALQNHHRPSCQRGCHICTRADSTRTSKWACALAHTQFAHCRAPNRISS